jgi:hypothetical protein
VGGSGVRRSVSGPKRTVPELALGSFKAQKRMVGTSPPLLGIVTHSGTLLMAIDREDDRIQVPNQPAGDLGHAEEFGAQLVVQMRYLANGVRGETLKKSAQGGLVGEGVKTQQVQEGAVVLEDLRFVEPPQSGDDGKEQGHRQVDRAVAMSLPMEMYAALQPPAQMKLVTKSFKKGHSTEVGQLAPLKRKPQCLQALGPPMRPAFTHFQASAKTYLKGSFWRGLKNLIGPRASGCFLSFQSRKSAFLRFNGHPDNVVKRWNRDNLPHGENLAFYYDSYHGQVP